MKNDFDLTFIARNTYNYRYREGASKNIVDEQAKFTVVKFDFYGTFRCIAVIMYVVDL